MGPDTHSFRTGPSSATVKYLHDFVTHCQALGVKLYGVTHHEYIEVNDDTHNGTMWTSLDPHYLDTTKSIADGVFDALGSLGLPGGVWAGEIGPHNGGSPPCSHESMRWANFANTFWYLDAMGTKARAGYKVCSLCTSVLCSWTWPDC